MLNRSGSQQDSRPTIITSAFYGRSALAPIEVRISTQSPTRGPINRSQDQMNHEDAASGRRKPGVRTRGMHLALEGLNGDAFPSTDTIRDHQPSCEDRSGAPLPISQFEMARCNSRLNESRMHAPKRGVVHIGYSRRLCASGNLPFWDLPRIVHTPVH